MTPQPRLLALFVAAAFTGTALSEQPATQTDARHAGPREAPLTDCYGDPLPPGAVARFGTVRLRHSSGVHSVALSPDGKLIASATSSNASVWDAGTGQELERFKRKLRAHVVEFTPDGKTLLAGSEDGTVQHWDVATGNLAREWKHDEKDGFRAQDVKFSADRRFLILIDSSQRSQLRLVDVTTGKPVLRLEKKSGLFSAAVSPDARTLATGGQDKVVRLWDVATGRMLREMEGHTNWVFAVRFSPDGKSLATCAAGTVRLWDLAGDRLIREIASPSQGLAFSPDGKALATSSIDSIHLWDVATGQQLRGPKGRSSWVIGLAFSSDGKRLVSGSLDRTIALWDVATGERVHQFEGQHGAVICLAFSPDDNRLVSGGDNADGTFLVWDVATAKRLHCLPGHVPSVWCVAFSPDGKTIATGEGFGGTGDLVCQIRLWDAASGRLDREFFGHLNCVQSLAYSPDGRTLASSGHDARVRLWDAASGKRLHQIRGLDAQKFLSFAPDGKSLLVADAYGGGLTLYATDTATKTRVFGVANERRRVLQAGFLPGGKALTSLEGLEGRRRGDHPTEVRYWDAASGEILRAFTVPVTAGVAAGMPLITVSADGKTLAVAESESAVHVWDAEAGRPLVTLQGHTGPVTALAFSHDGRFLASGSGDTTGLLWDLRQARLLGLWSRLVGKPPEAEEAVKALAAKPEGAVPFVLDRLRDARAREALFARLIADLDSDRFEVRDKASRQLEQAGATAEFALRLALQGQPSAEARRRIEELLSQRTVPREAKFERLLADLNSDDRDREKSAREALDLLDQDDLPYLRRAIELPQVRLRGQPGYLSPRARQSLTGALQGLLKRESSAPANPAAGVPIPAPAVPRAVKVLEAVGGPDARRALEELAHGPSDSRVAAEARAALGRLGKRDKEP
jgi:WD40 repeat protein